MKNKSTISFLLVALLVSGCSSLIYSIRGSKYKGRFNIATFPKELDSTGYYVRKYSSQNVYGYLKFNNNGVFYGYTSFGEKLQSSELDSTEPNENYYIFKNGYLRWEIYHDSYNGYNLYKAEVYQDSIVAWQIGFLGSGKANKITYYKLK